MSSIKAINVVQSSKSFLLSAKNKKYLYSAIAFLFASFELMSFAGFKSEGKTHLQVDVVARTAIIKVDDGFHINREAPTFLLNRGEKTKTSSMGDHQADFKWTGLLGPDAKIQYYVCDDGQTVCEPHTEILSAEASKSSGGDRKGVVSKTSIGEVNPQGFILDDYKLALKKAKQKNAIVLIDFSAVWCPACLRLDHETFNTEIFKAAASNVVLLKIDVDLEQNQHYLQTYSIRAFPTLVFTDSKGQEIDRILDFMPAEPLVRRIADLNKNRNQSIETAKTKARDGDSQAILFVGQNAYRSMQFADCVNWLKKLQDKPIEYYMCLLSQTEEASVEVQRASLGSAIKAFPESYYSIDWRLRLAKLFADEKLYKETNQQTLTDALALIERWIKDPELAQKAMVKGELVEMKDLLLPELYYAKGEALEALGKTEEARLSFEQSVTQCLALDPKVENPTIVIYLVHYLKKTKPVAESLQWLQKLERAYPKDFTYVHRQASLLADEKDFVGALPLAERAFSLSYGANRLRVGVLLADVQTKVGKITEAQKLLKDLLDSKVAHLPGNKRYLDKIEKLLSQLSQPPVSKDSSADSSKKSNKPVKPTKPAAPTQKGV